MISDHARSDGTRDERSRSDATLREAEWSAERDRLGDLAVKRWSGTPRPL
jgi:hypothetical protein